MALGCRSRSWIWGIICQPFDFTLLHKDDSLYPELGLEFLEFLCKENSRHIHTRLQRSPKFLPLNTATLLVCTGSTELLGGHTPPRGVSHVLEHTCVDGLSAPSYKLHS